MLEIVHTLRQEDSYWSWYGQLIKNIEARLNGLHSLFVGHIGKKVNEAAAHGLAETVIHWSLDRVWMKDSLFAKQDIYLWFLMKAWIFLKKIN